MFCFKCEIADEGSASCDGVVRKNPQRTWGLGTSAASPLRGTRREITKERGWRGGQAPQSTACAQNESSGVGNRKGGMFGIPYQSARGSVHGADFSLTGGASGATITRQASANFLTSFYFIWQISRGACLA